jgi:hypothetical protein
MGCFSRGLKAGHESNPARWNIGRIERDLPENDDLHSSRCAMPVYILVVFSSGPELVHEIERRMRVTDMVIKFITVRIDEKMKKIEKRKKARDKRAARRPAPQAAVPAAPAAPAPLVAPAEHATVLPGLPGEPKES